MKRFIKSSSRNTTVFDLSDALHDIAEKFVTSKPLSGDWDSEIDYEVEMIANAFNISTESAKALMINELGFDEYMFN